MSFFSKAKFQKLTREKANVQKRHTLLLVDDEEANLNILSNLFGREYHTLTANNGIEAFELVEKGDHKISLIISDQMMPGLTGTELFEKVLPLLPKAKRIILTAYTDLQAIMDSINKAQIYKFVLKPFDHHELMLTVKRALESYDLQEKLDDYAQNLEQKIKERTVELERQKAEILKTRDQLITQEKLASLGILTAGIAHEIKNPLNLIQNMSELTPTINEEVRDLLNQSQIKPDLLKEITDLIDQMDQNAGVVLDQSHKANLIVQTMMGLTKDKPGQRQPTNLNLLIGKFAQMAYHGIKAKFAMDPVEITHDLDPQLGLLEVVPQNISRAMVNLVNNALESIQERRAAHGPFDARLTIATKRHDDHIEISFTDNGIGIPQIHEDKIFDPFFTTKPPDGGNIGLGLMISHDIIVGEHMGQLSLQQEPDGAKFVIQLPLNPAEKQD